MPPVAARLAAYAAPTVPLARAPAAGVMPGLAGTLRVMLPVMLFLAVDIAVRVTVKAVVTVAGAV